MRRATTITSFLLSRTLATATVHHRLLTTATTSSTSYSGRRWFSTGSAQTVSLGVAGAIASVAAVASLSAQGVYAKEPLPADLVPKEVVLYQYEACPFCNKVKGRSLRFASHHLFCFSIIRFSTTMFHDILVKNLLVFFEYFSDSRN